MQADHLYPSFVFFICPSCHGSKHQRDNQFGDELTCRRCEGSGRLSVEKAILEWERENNPKFSRDRILKELDLVVPMKRAHMGVTFILDIFWHRQVESFVLEKNRG